MPKLRSGMKMVYVKHTGAFMLEKKAEIFLRFN